MKLYRFTASTTQRAIFTATKTLGPNALVYSTRKVLGGIEVLAGLPFGAEDIIDKTEISEPEVKVKKTKQHEEIKIQETSLDNKILESLKIEIETMHETIQSLSKSVSLLQQTVTERLKHRTINWSFLKKLNLPKMLKLKIQIHKTEVRSRG